MTEPLSTPVAVPLSFSCPAQVALNEPFAEVAVCSVTFQLKSVQVFGDGISEVEDQLPASAPMPVAVGSRLLLCSNSKQPVVVSASRDATAANANFFIMAVRTRFLRSR